jgi:hypothetical protein
MLYHRPDVLIDFVGAKASFKVIKVLYRLVFCLIRLVLILLKAPLDLSSASVLFKKSLRIIG